MKRTATAGATAWLPEAAYCGQLHVSLSPCQLPGPLSLWSLQLCPPSTTQHHPQHLPLFKAASPLHGVLLCDAVLHAHAVVGAAAAGHAEAWALQDDVEVHAWLD